MGLCREREFESRFSEDGATLPGLDASAETASAKLVPILGYFRHLQRRTHFQSHISMTKGCTLAVFPFP